MSRYRQSNQLPSNLPQLQNLIKRDPISYHDEFYQQYRHFESNVEVFELQPDEYNKALDDLVMFLAQVAQCYPEDLSTYPQKLMDLLQKHYTVLDPAMRITFCRALILLRNKNLLQPTTLLSLFFQLLKCPDKTLRKFLETHVITDIKNVNTKSKNAKLNATLQNFMHSMLKDSSAVAAKISLGIMIELYRKNIWNDAKTVNVITTALFSKVTKVVVAALKFFLGTDQPEKKDEDDSSSEDETPTLKQVQTANRVSGKTRKRKKKEEQLKKVLKKHKSKKKDAPAFNFSALHLINDPQSLAERLFQRLRGTNERFEVKAMMIEVISRLIGVHDLFVFNFYPFLQKYLQPHQRDVTKLLQSAAQAAHELIPPEVLEPVVSAIVNNFVTERNSGEAMAVGLNTLRELCARCPLAIEANTLQDLVQYKNYHDKNVRMAARSLMQLYRELNPDMLRKKDRGRPTEAQLEAKPRQYGETDIKEYIPGAEVVNPDERELEDGDEHSSDEESDDSDGEWVNISHSNTLDDSQEIDIDIESSDDEGPEPKKPKTVQQERENMREKIQKKKELAKEKSAIRIFDDLDFRQIEAAQVQKQISRNISVAQKRAALEEPEPERGEIVSLRSIEKLHKKAKLDKESRVADALLAAEQKEKYKTHRSRMNPHASTSNKEKLKKKNFMMVRHKIKGKKMSRSFKERQISLRNSLLKQKRNNKL